MTTPFAPQNVSLEATRLCNLKCIMCPTHKANADPQIIAKYPAYFDIDRYRDIIDQLAELDVPLHIGPQFQGEPLLASAIFEMVRVAKGKGFSTGFSTNAVMLTEKVSRELIASGLDALCISVDAVTKETFEKIRVGARYDRVMRNINAFLSLRGKTPSVCINGVRQPDNEGEIDRLPEVWLDRVESVSISNVWTEDGKPTLYYDPVRLPCRSLWTNMIVLTNGDVIPCCNPLFDLSMGNAFETPIWDIWNGYAYQHFRELHEAGRWNEIKPCSNCYTWMTSISERRRENGYAVDVYPFHKVYHKGDRVSLASRIKKVLVGR